MRKFLILIILLMLVPIVSLAGTDEDCLICHEDPDLKAEDDRPMFVDAEVFSSSVHANAGFSCTDCHTDLQGVEDFPHAEKLVEVSCGECHDKAEAEFNESIHYQARLDEDFFPVSCSDCHGSHDIKETADYNSRVFHLNLPQTCERCHLERVKTERGGEFIKNYEKSIHYEGLEKLGLSTSSNCSNCHGAHDIRGVHDSDSRVSRKNIIETCASCHVGIKIDYLEGVHGKDYLQGNLDVPVCTDCHSEHDISSPQDLDSSVYATKVSENCAQCHDDEALSAQYGFLTSRGTTYSKSFHGTASMFGEARVANCASCHGFHGIRPSTDPKSTIHPDNIPATCGVCHPGAGKHFAEGKIHVVSERETNKWAYYVKLIYTILIAGIVAVFLVFIAADLFHRVLNREEIA